LFSKNILLIHSHAASIYHSPPKTGGQSSHPFAWLPAFAGMTEKDFTQEVKKPWAFFISPMAVIFSSLRLCHGRSGPPVKKIKPKIIKAVAVFAGLPFQWNGMC
jgi:hypothetical protein